MNFAANGLISIRVAAQWLEYTEGYVRSLVRALSKSDVGAVLDQRAGQRCDYRVDALRIIRRNIFYKNAREFRTQYCGYPNF